MVDLEAGFYTVTVSDANGCIKLGSYEVTQPDEMVIGHSATMNTCYKSNDGTIDLTISGGVRAPLASSLLVPMFMR